MNINDILDAVQVAQNAALVARNAIKEAHDLYEVARDTLSSDDKAQVERALEALQKENDTEAEKTLAKLRQSSR